jgi:hypothetical protein
MRHLNWNSKATFIKTGSCFLMCMKFDTYTIVFVAILNYIDDAHTLSPFL